MTPDERAELRELVDRTRRRLAGVEPDPVAGGVCAHPKCRMRFEVKKHTAKQRYCSARCRNLDWFRLHPEVQREYTRARRGRQREATA